MTRGDRLPSVIDIFSICSLQEGIARNEGGRVLCKYGGHFGFSTSDARFSLFLTLSSREVLLGVYRGFFLILQTLEIAKWHRIKFFCDFFVGSLGRLRILPYFCIAIGTQGSLAKTRRA